MAGELWKILLSVHVIPLCCFLLALPLYHLRRRPGVIGAACHRLLILPVGCGVLFFSYLLYFLVRLNIPYTTDMDIRTAKLPLGETVAALGMFVAHLIVDSLPPRPSPSGLGAEERLKDD
mmetsp:Transcript_109668/g.341802  ORF Transcript_109668/g.341802 Transcript_109668/m.341802 type:complete len:120 (-) Transcript_109668:306-665(-)